MSANKKKKKNKNLGAVETDIVILITLGVSVLLFLSALGLCGIIGQGISFVLFGLAGTPAYAFPFVLFFVVWLIIANRDKNDTALFKRRLIGISGLYVLACAFFELVMIGYSADYFV